MGEGAKAEEGLLGEKGVAQERGCWEVGGQKGWEGFVPDLGSAQRVVVGRGHEAGGAVGGVVGCLLAQAPLKPSVEAAEKAAAA